MNTVMDDPTTERLMPLIAAAAQAGGGVLLHRCRLVRELGDGWWDTVGVWRPSVNRFAVRLPDGAFFTRCGL